MSWEVPTMAFMKSCFNGTLYRKNLKRYWPLMAVFTVIWGIYYGLGLASQLSAQYLDLSNGILRTGITAEKMPYYACLYLLERAETYLSVLLMLAMGTVTAWAVFSYLFSAKSASAYHALPIQREGLFLTAVLSGLTILAVPTALNLLGILAVEAAFGALESTGVLTVAAVLCGGQLIFFAIAVLFAILAGSAPGMLLLTAVFNFLSVFLEAMAGTAATWFLYGISYTGASSVAAWLSPAWNIVSNVCTTYEGASATNVAGLENLWYYGVYAIAAVVLLGLALLIYRRRPVESAGNLLAFPKLRPIFTVGVGVCLALLMTAVIQELYMQSVSLGIILALLVAWAFVGWFAALMVVHRSFRVFRKKTVLGWAALSVVLCVAVGCCYADVLGLEDYVPAVSEIESAQVWVNGVEETDPAAVTALHQLILRNKDAMESREDGDCYYSVSFAYVVNGREVQRTYNLYVMRELVQTPGTVEAGLLDYFSDPARMEQELFGGLNVDEPLYGSVYYDQSLYASGTDEEIGYVYGDADLTPDECQTLLEAIRADLAEGHSWETDSLLGNESSGYQLEFVFRGQSGSASAQTALIEDAAGSAAVSEHVYLLVGASMTHTLQALEELGISERLNLDTEYYEDLVLA